MRTRTRQQGPARPEGGYLAVLPGLAKGKIQTNLTQVFEADPAEEGSRRLTA
jgi:hypothetical protein